LPSGETGSEPYSFSTRTKSKGLVEALNNFIKENAYDTNVIIPIPPPAPVPISPKFDQVVQGNVDIKKLSRKKYKITFSEIRKFLLYQVWLDSSQQLNENRKAFYQNVKLWIENYNLLNDSLKAFNKPLFTPTVVMEIGSKKYLFVLNKVKLNGKGHIVFKVSTKEIKSSDKKILNFPRGHHDGVRFDIDAVKDWQTCTVNGPNESYPRSTYCQECRNCYSGCSNYQTCSCDSYCNVCTKFPCS
jgi:hypothetical protein